MEGTQKPLPKAQPNYKRPHHNSQPERLQGAAGTPAPLPVPKHLPTVDKSNKKVAGEEDVFWTRFPTENFKLIFHEFLPVLQLIGHAGFIQKRRVQLRFIIAVFVESLGYVDQKQRLDKQGIVKKAW